MRDEQKKSTRNESRVDAVTTLYSKDELKEKIKWEHVVPPDYFQLYINEDYIYFDTLDKTHGPILKIQLHSSARGVNCYEKEIDSLIKYLKITKSKLNELKKGIK